VVHGGALRRRELPGLLDATGQPTDEADRSAGGTLVASAACPTCARTRWPSACARCRNPRLHRAGAVAAAFAPRGVMSTRPLRETVMRVVPSGWAGHPALWVVATDLSTGRRVVFGREDAPPAELAAAVAASCAVPGIYRPVLIGDRTYVDGGAWSPSNLDSVARAGLDLVLCLNPLSSSPEELLRARRGAVRGGMRRATGRRLGWEARRLRERGTQVELLQPVAEDLEVMGGNLMSTARRHLVLETAQRTVAQQIARSDLPRLLAVQPRAPEHRVHRPPGPVESWPTEVLPPRTSVAPSRRPA
jgi:NTE family protein